MESIPNELVEKINQFKLVRNTYNSEYAIYNETVIAEKDKIEEESKTTKFKSPTCFTVDQLKELSLNIGSNYENKKFKFKGGVPYSICQLLEPVVNIFKNIDLDVYNLDLPDGCDKNKKISKYADLEVPAKLNLIFMDCVNIITSMDIEICAIDTKIKNYHNKTASMLCGECDVFKFYCRKDNIKLEFVFYDDCDWIDGFLAVENMTDTLTQTTLNHHMCFEVSDYFETTHDDYHARKFFSALKGISAKDFKNNIYGHLMQLPQLLIDLTDYEISSTEMPVDFFDNSINVNYNPAYYIYVRSGNKCCILTPASSTELLISNSVINTIWKDDHHVFEYKSVSDINKLITCIREYLLRSDGAYGYIQDNIYYNEKNFNTKFPKMKNLYIANDINNLTGFDLYFILHGCKYNTSCLTKDRLSTSSYIVDYYGIRFRYNQNKNPSDCILTINPICVDAIALANEYYGKKSVSENKLREFFPLVTICKPYLDCVAIIEDFKLLLSK